MKCRACGKQVSTFKAYFTKGENAGAGWFCSPACVHSMYPSADVEGGCNPFLWLVSLPFSFASKLVKLFFKLTVKCIRLCGKLIWMVLKNKWMWTVFTCGISWAVWKILNAIYAPKK